MTFQPIVPGLGIVGWQFLQRTYASQFESFNQSNVLKRDVDYFLENIGSISSAEELVGDRRLLTVALGAFGLEDDIDNRFFIKTILEEGTLANDSLARRLSDERYEKLSAAFGFGPSEILTTFDSTRMQEVVDLFRTQSFEVAVGEQNDTLRIALFAQREIQNVIDGNSSDDARWFSVLGNPPLRNMFETALGLPSQVGQIDIDDQLEIFRERANSVFGDGEISQFSQQENLNRVTNLYLARSQIDLFSTNSSSAANALVLLSA